MAVEMRSRFEETLGCPLRPTLLFDYPTIEALVDHLVARVTEERASALPTPAPAIEAGAPVADDLEGLDEDALADQLAQELLSISRVQQQ
jgi:hypothetical protein